MKLYAYNNASESAKALSVALGIKRIKHEGKPLKVDLLLNWGCSNITRDIACNNILNQPRFVGQAVNKITAFRHLDVERVNTPDWCTGKDRAAEIIESGHAVVCRTKLNGHSGEGIVIANTVEELVDAPLYVQYVKKTQEYRLHVMHNEVFFIQRKARKVEIPDEEVNWQVRNLAGGFIYANQNVEVGEQAKMEAVRAIMALGLDFGAVDVIYNQQEDKYYVLEVNTACGLAGTTLDKYVEQFRRYL
jgi:glutathione synthase/RimK-type ligase-like ATP-grasp enzyme